MRLQWFQHVPFEDLANIDPWATAHGFEVRGTRLFDGEEPSPGAEFDWLVVMGGSMNIYEEDRYPWLAAEKLAIERAVRAGAVVVGVCLGAQLLADVLGGIVVRNPVPEIGWFPVRLTDAGRESTVFGALPDTFDAFHWHGDVIRSPGDAVVTAVSDVCPVQAFELDGLVFGLQFHLESTEESIDRLIGNAAGDLVDVPTVQQPREMRGRHGELAAIETSMTTLLDAVFRETE
jgi:GMP synthase-like glutamine amidotransferase